MFLCLDKTDSFGNEVNMTHHGDWASGYTRQLAILYRPCYPKQRTVLNKDDTDCLVDDLRNATQLEAMLDRSKKYVGDA